MRVTGSAKYLDGQEVFRLWAQLGSMYKVMRWYQERGIINHNTGEPIKPESFYDAAYHYALYHPEEFRDSIKDTWVQNTPQWEKFLINRALWIFRGGNELQAWLQSQNLLYKAIEYGLIDYRYRAIDPNRDKIIHIFRGRCIRCMRPANVVHEDEPRSLRPKTWAAIENRTPLCDACHEWVHQQGAMSVITELKTLKKKRLMAFYGSEDYPQI